jgi:hypothetical protein
MKKKMLLLSALVLMVVVFATILTGCCWFKKKETVIENGFTRKDLGLSKGIATAIRTDKFEFSIDDITLEFFYGTEIQISLQSERYELICIGVYLTTVGFENLFSGFEDYQNIENVRLVKTISIEEFNSDDYIVTTNTSILKGYTFTFNYSEKLTVPEDLFNYTPERVGVKGVLGFLVSTVMWDNEEETYVFLNKGANPVNARIAEIRYELLKDNRIHFSK